MVIVQIPLGARRLAYRTAFRWLTLVWLVRRPTKEGVKCLIVNGDRFLLVRHTYGDRVWDVPGGALKRGEDPLAAAQREMREELGIAGARWTPLGAVHGVVHHRRDTIHCFAAEPPSDALQLDLGELETARWFDPAQLPADVAPYVGPVLSLRAQQR